MSGKTFALILFFPALALAQIRIETGVVAQPVTIGQGIRLRIPELQPETLNWQNAVRANSGSYSATDTQAVDYFVTQTKLNGLWPLLDWVALFAGQNLNASLVPLKRTVGDAVMTNNNFVEADFSPTTGLTGNGTTKDLVTGILDNQLVQNSISAGVWLTTLPATGGSSRGYLGTTFGSSPALILYRGSSGPTNAKVHSAGTATGSNTAIGFIFARRTAGSTQFVGVNTGETSSIDASSAPGANAIRIFSLAGGTYNNGAIGAAFIGQGLTSQQAQDLRAILQQTMTILGRPTS